ncbi:MAG: hypothetical protein MJA84_08180 [Firmicutes bacterium]|nr:hypothetical protein [Bacillota bacterium]
MTKKRRVQGKLRDKNLGEAGGNNIETLGRMINASRAFRSLPPEMTVGKRYDGGRRED